MKVLFKTQITDLHSIEIGNATWDNNEISIRNRYDLPTGKFSPRGSSEIPILDIRKLVGYACTQNALSVDDLLSIIKHATESIEQKIKDTK